MRPVIPTVLWGRVRVPSGPQKSLTKNVRFFVLRDFIIYIITEIRRQFFPNTSSTKMEMLQIGRTDIWKVQIS